MDKVDKVANGIAWAFTGAAIALIVVAVTMWAHDSARIEARHRERMERLEALQERIEKDTEEIVERNLREFEREISSPPLSPREREMRERGRRIIRYGFEGL